jgi:hypothetical protein
MVELLVGEDAKQRTIYVHRDLLTLYSETISKHFNEVEQEEQHDVKPLIIAQKAPHVADFVSWIYVGEFLKIGNSDLAGGQAVDELWQLGHELKAPAFQNFCMDDCRTYYKESETNPE